MPCGLVGALWVVESSMDVHYVLLYSITMVTKEGVIIFIAKFHAKLKDELNYLSNVEINKQTSYSVNLTTDLLTMCRGGITIFV